MKIKQVVKNIFPIFWGAWFQPDPKREEAIRYLFIGGWRIPFTKKLFLIQIPFKYKSSHSSIG